MKLMSDTPDLSIVVPLHNEQLRLDKCIRELIGFIGLNELDAEVLLVPNGCWDATLEMCYAYHDRFPWVRVLPLLQRGKGAAVRNGMLTARGNYIYMADVDLSTPVHEINYFLETIRAGYDLVIGNRQIHPEWTTTSARRRLFSRVFNWCTGLLAPGISDTQCGFKMFTHAAAVEIFRRSQINGWAFDVEVLYLAARLGLRVYQLPVVWSHDMDSRVRLLPDSFAMLVDLIKIPLSHAHQRIEKVPA